MKLTCRWTGSLTFVGATPSHEVTMDTKAPVGRDQGMSPKELVVAGLCGCTAMDVVSYLRKHKQPIDTLEVSAEVRKSEGKTPSVFVGAELRYSLTGKVDGAALLEAVRLSQTQDCGVSAMLSKAFPIAYRVELNGQEIGIGEAKFA